LPGKLGDVLILACCLIGVNETAQRNIIVFSQEPVAVMIWGQFDLFGKVIDFFKEYRPKGDEDVGKGRKRYAGHETMVTLNCEWIQWVLFAFNPGVGQGRLEKATARFADVGEC
jgi:hypothetical protein